MSTNMKTSDQYPCRDFLTFSNLGPGANEFGKYCAQIFKIEKSEV